MSIPVITDRRVDCYRAVAGKPGQYLVRLVCKVDGRRRQKTVPCNNPAYGLGVLDQWGLDVIDRPKVGLLAAASLK